MWALVSAAAAGDAEYDRLFGPEPPPTEQAAAPVPPPAAAPVAGASAPLTTSIAPYQPPEVPGWAFSVAAVVAGGAAMVWLKKRSAGAPPAPLTVLQRQPIGDRSSLVLVEVLTAEGERRRLLIGTGGGGPSLVSDLGGGFDDPGPVSLPAPAAAPMAAPVVAPAAAPGRPAPTPAPAATPVVVTAAPALRVTAANSPPPKSAANIAEEVLIERRTRGRWLAVAGDDE